MFFPAPGELLIIGLLIVLFIAGKYFYNKLRESKYVYEDTVRNKDR